MDQLRVEYDALQTELAAAKRAMCSRPRTAPPRLEPFYVTLHKASTNATISGCGGGEELTPLSEVTTHRILVPGDTLPFVGVIGEPNNVNSRKHLINQWRTLRHLSPVSKTRHPSPSPREGEARPRPSSAHSKLTPSADEIAATVAKQRVEAKPAVAELRQREKSPKSVLREAKARLRNKDVSKKPAGGGAPREKSPTAVLREAKLRLRKLEIEAEVVERSYRDFRRRQEAGGGALESAYSSPHKTENVQTVVEASQTTRKSCDKIFKDYSDSYDAYFKNRNASSVRASPVPKEMAQSDRANNVMEKINDNYLDKPLLEFRKLYQCQNVDSQSTNKEQKQSNKQTTETITVVQHKNSNEQKETYRAEQINKQAEYEILQQNINKIYNIEEPIVRGDNPALTLHQAVSTDWDKSEAESKNYESGRIELKVSLVCEDDESAQPEKTKLTVDLNTGLMLDCPTDTEVEVEEFILNREKVLSFDPNIPMKTTLLADVESFKNHEKSRQSPHSEFLMFIGSSGADNVEDSSVREISVEYDADKEITRILNGNTKEEIVASVEKRSRSRSPELEANITRNDVLEAIYNTKHEDLSNDENGETDQDGSGDFADDFSADVDNYNNINNVERSSADSPHSIPKSESKSDDNFWDS